MKAALFYNQTLNLIWTVLGFAPVLAFWWQYEQTLLLYPILLLSLLPLFFPARWLAKLQLSRRRSVYRLLGVKTAQNLSQNGTMVNRLIRKQHPAYVLLSGRKDLKKYRAQMEVYEKYHLACFVFFSFTLVLSFAGQFFGLASLILLANIVYNLYPLLIQQYNKLRMPREQRL